MSTQAITPGKGLSRADEAELRQVVGSIAAGFGHEYFAKASAAGSNASELWDALAEGGFVGANIPEEFGGGGMGLTALSVIAEEVAAAGCPLIMLIISPAIVGSILTRHGTQAQQERWLTGIGRAPRRSRSRSPNRTLAPTRTASRPRPGETATATS
jgi:alkylation response protein AidB-like acyl-CoA dehydrogenase